MVNNYNKMASNLRNFEISAENPRNGTEKPKNGKRKRSFLQKEKRRGKKGRFGQGVELTEDQYNYFLRILGVFNATKDTEDLEILACNVIDEMSGTEVDTCSNQMASRVVERVVEHAPDDKLIALTKIMGDQLRLVYSDPYCSHVLQKIAVTLAKRIMSSPASGLKTVDRKPEVTDALKAEFLRIARFGINNIEDFMFDTYANHVLRTIFTCLSGHPVKTESNKENNAPSGEALSVPEEFSELAVSAVQKVTSWPQFNDLTIQVLPSGCLQVLVVSVSGSKKLSKIICQRVLEAIQAIPSVDLSSNAPLAHLIEATITVAPPKLSKKFYELLFKGKLADLAMGQGSNFAVQKLVSSCHTKEIFEEMFDELVGKLEELYVRKMFGVLLAVAKSCARHKAKQGEFFKAIQRILDCSEPAERQLLVLPLTCSLTRHTQYDPANSPINIFGSQIAQQMLHFTKPIKMVQSLLSMNPDQLVTLLSDPRGCYVADAFITSQFVGEKSREKLYKKLQGQYVALATSKHGSRAFDAVWSCLNTKQMGTVAEELKSKQSAVVGDQWGRFVARKVKLDLFRQDKDAWYKNFLAEEKKKTAERSMKKTS